MRQEKRTFLFPELLWFGSTWSRDPATEASRMTPGSCLRLALRRSRVVGLPIATEAGEAGRAAQVVASPGPTQHSGFYSGT